MRTILRDESGLHVNHIKAISETLAEMETDRRDKRDTAARRCRLQHIKRRCGLTRMHGMESYS